MRSRKESQSSGFSIRTPVLCRRIAARANRLLEKNRGRRMESLLILLTAVAFGLMVFALANSWRHRG